MSTRPLILVVDDEALVRDVIAKLTEHLGYAVTTAASGAEAIEACRRVEPSAVVLDVRMPELDGPSTLDSLRNDLPELPYVFVSGDSRPYTVAELLGRGRTVFLNKPVSLKQLETALEGMVSPDGGSHR